MTAGTMGTSGVDLVLNTSITVMTEPFPGPCLGGTSTYRDGGKTYGFLKLLSLLVNNVAESALNPLLLAPSLLNDGFGMNGESGLFAFCLLAERSALLAPAVKSLAFGSGLASQLFRLPVDARDGDGDGEGDEMYTGFENNTPFVGVVRFHGFNWPLISVTSVEGLLSKEFSASSSSSVSLELAIEASMHL